MRPEVVVSETESEDSLGKEGITLGGWLNFIGNFLEQNQRR
jgi:hypothetical protein